MTMREVIRLVLDGQRPPYVPWSCGFTQEARMKLQLHFGTEFLAPLCHSGCKPAPSLGSAMPLEKPDICTKPNDYAGSPQFNDAVVLEQCLDNHLVKLGSDIGFFEDIGEDRFRDVFGVVWNRSVDKDIGIVEGCVLPEPTLAGFSFPDPLDKRYFADIPEKLARYGDRFRVFQLGFSLYERAWTLRGMENLMLDFLEHPDFVEELFNAIADYNIAEVKEAMKYDIDAVYFGDDWGQQHGLQMGPRLWRRFILPVLRRMYCAVRMEGKYVMIHSCGDVDELFDDLIEAGVNCFNPFQPEVMDVYDLLPRYRSRLAFHGGLSTQRTLPFGCVEDVRAETRRLLELGCQGGYIFAPAHDVEGDVPVENILAFLEILQKQPGYQGR